MEIVIGRLVLGVIVWFAVTYLTGLVFGLGFHATRTHIVDHTRYYTAREEEEYE